MQNTLIYKKWAKRALLVVIGLALILSAVRYLNGFSSGTRVLAQREENIWYGGKIEGRCASGYTVIYDRGAKQCLTRNSIIKDEIAKKEDIKVGTKVIAQWKGEPYYNAKVIELVGEKFKVEYYDTVKNIISLSELRVRE